MGRRPGLAGSDDQQPDAGLQRLGRWPDGRPGLHARSLGLGALANNIWSLGGRQGISGNSYNNFLTQPFVNYNFGGGWFVSTAPIITSDWQAKRTKWTFPFGGSVGRVIQIGKLPVNLSLGAYYNAIRPVDGSDWQMRSQMTLVF